jgi:hypothetical protein
VRFGKKRKENALCVPLHKLLPTGWIDGNIPKTLHSSVSSCTPPGSRLSRMVPSKRAASWGIIARRRRRSSSPIVEVLSPSMIMLPLVGSIIRNKASVRLDFPAPVRPTTPIFSCGLIERLMSLSTRSSPSRYLVL